MIDEKKIDIVHKKNYSIVKSNDLIQKSRFDLTLTEQKIVLRLIQMIQPDDKELKYYQFDIQEFCDICGIDKMSGGNYSYIKNTVQRLRDKSFFIDVDGKEVICSWINKARLKKSSGIIEIRLDDDLKPYLLNLKNKFTVYSFYNVLSMKSKYSPRLYELLKSEQYKRCFTYDLDHLKKLLNAERYEMYGNFKQKVLNVALREINETTDIIVECEPLKTKKKYTKIRFTVRSKTTSEQVQTLTDRNRKGAATDE